MLDQARHRLSLTGNVNWFAQFGGLDDVVG